MKNIFDGYGTFAKIVKTSTKKCRNGLNLTISLCTVHKFAYFNLPKNDFWDPRLSSFFHISLTATPLFGQ